MGDKVLSQDLLAKGWFSALGTTEKSGKIVEKRIPMTHDYNNGIHVVYDENGRPWIKMRKHLNAKDDDLFDCALVRGAYVPHSNDGGRFARKVFMTLVLMKVYRAENMEELLDIIGAGIEPYSEGPVVARVQVWTGVFIEAVYGQKPNNDNMLVGDVETYDDIFFNVEPIRSFAERLLKTGESFFTVCGTDDMVCSLEWKKAD